ncbi:MAG: hypothetical protein ACE5HC_10790 [Candidatus Binatia bacterium]
MTNRAATYNYHHFHRKLMGMRSFSGPKPGETAPDFNGLTLEGRKVQLSRCRGLQHVVLQFGSLT